jgi:predicted dehydrogenase
MLGTGFWSRYQLAGWNEAGGAECVALYNRTVQKARKLADEFGVPHAYGDVEELLENEDLDFVDICTNVETHHALTLMAAARKLPVVCQKPMADSLMEAERMVYACHEASVPLFINENFRFQEQIRACKVVLDSGRIGKVFRGRIEFCSSFPVFENQPFLKEVEKFILADVGSHILDVVRFLFGEVESLLCTHQRIHPDIRGEDVATVLMTMRSGATVIASMSYASRTEHERFPQTFVFAEGDRGSAELTTDYWVRETTREGTLARRHPPPRYGWADPAYDVVHASIVPCQKNILEGLAGGSAETTGEDNLRTVRLVHACYESAGTRKPVALPL